MGHDGSFCISSVWIIHFSVFIADVSFCTFFFMRGEKTKNVSLDRWIGDNILLPGEVLKAFFVM